MHHQNFLLFELLEHRTEMPVLSLPAAISPFGMYTIHFMSSFAACIAADAEVLPVEAQINLSVCNIFACVTAVDIPLSLNEPLGLYPSGCQK